MLILCRTPTQATSMPWMKMRPRLLILKLIRRQKQSAPNTRDKHKNGPGLSKTLTLTYSYSLGGGLNRRAWISSPTSCHPCEHPVDLFINDFSCFFLIKIGETSNHSVDYRRTRHRPLWAIRCRETQPSHGT